MTANAPRPQQRPPTTRPGPQAATPVTIGDVFQSFGERINAIQGETARVVQATEQILERTKHFAEEPTPKVRTKDVVYAAIQERAKSFAEPGMSGEEAVDRLMRTTEGEQLYREYRAAPPAPPVPVTASDPFEGRSQQYREVNAKIDRAADELRAADPALSREQAVVQVLERRPQLFAEYRDACRADRSMRGI